MYIRRMALEMKYTFFFFKSSLYKYHCGSVCNIKLAVISWVGEDVLSGRGRSDGGFIRKSV